MYVTGSDWPTDYRQATDCWPTVGRQLADSWLPVGGGQLFFTITINNNFQSSLTVSVTKIDRWNQWSLYVMRSKRPQVRREIWTWLRLRKKLCTDANTNYGERSIWKYSPLRRPSKPSCHHCYFCFVCCPVKEISTHAYSNPTKSLPESFVGKIQGMSTRYPTICVRLSLCFVRIDVKNYNFQISEADNFVDKKLPNNKLITQKILDVSRS